MSALPDYVSDFLSGLDSVRRSGDGWLALCPVPGHGRDGRDSSPSLRVTVGEQGRILVRCRAGCETSDVLSSLGLNHSALYPRPGEAPAESLASVPSSGHDPDGKSRDQDIVAETLGLRHAVYSALLDRLELSVEHRKNLLERGLPKEAQDANKYRTYRTESGHTLAHDLHARFGEDIYLVPGFIHTDSGPSIVPSVGGLVVPIRAADGRIQSLKSRRQTEPKYLIWSGHGGMSAGRPVHHALCSPGDPGPDSPLRIVEGELNADVCAHLTGIETIAVPGVANWNVLFGKLDPKRYHLIAFDWPDVLSNGAVCTALCSLLRYLSDVGIPFFVETWTDLTCKGLDDLLAEGKLPDRMPGPDALAFVTTRLAHLKKEAEKKMEESKSTPAVSIPESIRPKPPERLPFPAEVYPPTVRTFVEEVSKALPCPIEFPGVGVLAVSSAAIGTARKVRMKQSYEEFGPIYAAIIAEPSTLKSPALKAVMKPLEDIDAELYARYELDQKIYAKRKAAYDVHHALWKQSHKDRLKTHLAMSLSPDLFVSQSQFDTIEEKDRTVTLPDGKVERYVPYPDPPTAPKVPEEETCRIQEHTVEGLVKSFASSPRGCLGFFDELTQLFNDFNKYRSGQGSDRQFFLSTWQCSTYKAIRKGSPTIDLKSPFLAILGGVQPGKLGCIREDRGAEDGFFARFLFAMPDAEVCPVFEWTADVAKEVFDSWAATVRALRTYQRGPKDSERTLGFTDEAKVAFDLWHEAHRREPDAEDFPPGLRGSWGKMKAYCFRLALVIHMLRQACGEFPRPEDAMLIDAEDMARAIKLSEYFKSHARYVLWKTAEPARAVDIKAFTAWLRRHGGRCTARDLARSGRWGLHATSMASSFLAAMEDLGVVESQTAPNKAGRRVLQYYLTDPALTPAKKED